MHTAITWPFYHPHIVTASIAEPKVVLSSSWLTLGLHEIRGNQDGSAKALHVVRQDYLGLFLGLISAYHSASEKGFLYHSDIPIVFAHAHMHCYSLDSPTEEAVR